MSRPASTESHRADDAFAVHAALLKAECENPALRRNPQWTIMRQDAFERFVIALREAK